MRIYFAPLQGYTDDAYRRVHKDVCGGVDVYVTPFIRLINGELRPKDKRDIRKEFNEGVNVLPQIMASSRDEMRKLVDGVLAEGYTHVNLNMGCPFPLQTRHGHGAGILPHPEMVEEVCRTMEEYADVAFSVKMRLGLEEKDEWRQVLPILNGAKLEHVTVHPRIGSQQYKGELFMDEFDAFISECKHPVIYNGDILSVEDIERIATEYPQIEGIMIGRGLLSRPTLAKEYVSGKRLDERAVVSQLRTLHDRLYHHNESIVPGEDALLNKVRTFWDYAEPTIGRKAWKKIKKAGNLKNYLASTASI